MPGKKSKSASSTSAAAAAAAAKKEEEKEETFDQQQVQGKSFGLNVGALLHQCAESHVHAADFCGISAIVKTRPKKDYRHPTLDERIRNGRMLREARALARAAKANVPVPAVYSVDKPECSIVMERIDGCTVREVLTAACAAFGSFDCVSVAPNLPCAAFIGAGGGGAGGGGSGNNRKSGGGPNPPPNSAAAANATAAVASSSSSAAAASSSVVSAGSDYYAPAVTVCTRILRFMGHMIGRLHINNCIHGDLTTSNFLLRGGHRGALPFFQSLIKNSNKNKNATPAASSSNNDFDWDGYAPDVVAIDFGLVSDSTSAEDRAVDLYVLERAVLSTHPTLGKAADAVIEGYKAEYEDAPLFPPSAVEVAAQQHKPQPKNTTTVTQVLDRLNAVRERGRKRSMLG